MKKIISIFLFLLTAFSTTALAEDYVAYLCAYMKGSDEYGMYYAIAENNSFLFDEVNQGKRILIANGSDRLVRDPHLLRCPDGKFRMVATVSWTKRPFTYWESTDLVNWENETLVDIAPANASKTWAPELIYDEEQEQYMCYWTAEVNNDWNTASIYYATTKDFQTWSEAKPLYQQFENGNQVGILDANITKVNGQYVMLFRYNDAIHKAVATSCTGPYTYVSEVNNENVEGPFMWALNDGSGYAYMFDYFGGSAGFGLLTTTDLTNWTRITNTNSPYYNSNVRFPDGIRHGSVIGITAEELQYLKENLKGQEPKYETTGYGLNMDMEGGTSGWTETVDEGAHNFRTMTLWLTNANGALTDNVLEIWNEAGKTYTRTISQTITDLPNGTYIVSAGVMAVDQTGGDASAIKGTVKLFANSETADVEIFTKNTDDANLTNARIYTISRVTVTDGTLTIGVKADATTANWMAMDNFVVRAIDTWSVIGYPNWDTDTDMATTDGVNYSVSLKDATLEQGTKYEFKVRKGHDWTTSYGFDGGTANAWFTVSETAKYTIDFTFNAETLALTATTTKTGEAGEITHTYTVAGSPKELFGTEWKQDDANNDMTDDDGDGIYAKTYKSVTLTAGTVAFKICLDHAWTVAYPSSNYELTIPADGTYDVTIIFDSKSHEVSASATNAATGIIAPKFTRNDNAAAPLHALSGLKVGAGYKGIAIRNGKKIIIR